MFIHFLIYSIYIYSELFFVSRDIISYNIWYHIKTWFSPFIRTRPLTQRFAGLSRRPPFTCEWLGTRVSYRGWPGGGEFLGDLDWSNHAKTLGTVAFQEAGSLFERVLQLAFGIQPSWEIKTWTKHGSKRADALVGLGNYTTNFRIGASHEVLFLLYRVWIILS